MRLIEVDPGHILKPTMTETRIGMIGLGVMGGAMARRLAARYPVIGYDADRKRLSILKALSSGPVATAASAEPTRRPSFTAVSSITALAAASDVVILSLPTTAVVETVIAGDDGLLNAMRPGSKVIDMSTTEPDTTRRLAALLAERDVALVDAPVSGGQNGAEEGPLSVMSGGDPDLGEKLRPILETVGSSVVRVGPVGSGGVAKLVNNMIVGAAFTSIAEGIALSDTAGLEPRDLHAAIR
ncbi:MAG: NAD(P)-dependent oxidoreductase, partial [Spirochaeta sp.]|nr:NAD(P)-dependent oxidoreductase [Spirochaeta sp.]